MKFLLATAFMMGSISAAEAWDDLERMKVANLLGNLLASEEFCRLEYDQAAIGKFIDETVPADDMGFNPMLETMVGGTEFSLESMTGSQKAAHCRQTERVARSYGFID